MRQPEGESRLRWHDAILIIAIIAILVVAFLFQLAHRADALPTVTGAYASLVMRVTAGSGS
jgi:hypothetical protein